MRLDRLIGPELEALLKEDPSQVAVFLREVHPEDLADLVDGVSDERAAELLRELPTDYAAQVFGRLDEDRQEQLAQRMGIPSVAELAVEMDADERADFFSVLPPELGESLLEHIEEKDPDVAEDVEELTRWPESSAGGLMTTDYLSLPAHFTISEAIDEIRRHAEQVETVDVAFVVEGDERLVGVLPLRRVLLAKPNARVEDVMIRSAITVPPELDQEQVAQKIAKYDVSTMPVVAESGELLGVITSDDVLDVLTQEQDEDVHKMGALEPIRDSYLDTSLGMLVRKRAPWLLVLFLGGFLSTQAMQAYESTLAAVTELAFYLPLLVSAGGNSGAQSSTLIIRSLATGDLVVGDWYKVFTRELMQGLILGGVLAAVGMARVLLTGDGIAFASLIGVTIVAIVLMGCLVGALTPLLLHRLRVDPATSSTPFIATMIDVLGIVFYLSMARLLLGELLT